MRRKSVFRWDPGGKNPFEKEREKGLDRVELRSWMENAPRNIPDIVWEQFSRQPRNDVSFPLRYKCPEVAGPQQTATALPRASSTPKEPLTLETTREQVERDRRLSGGIPKVEGLHRRLIYLPGNRILLERAHTENPRC